MPATHSNLSMALSAGVDTTPHLASYQHHSHSSNTSNANLFLHHKQMLLFATTDIIRLIDSYCLPDAHVALKGVNKHSYAALRYVDSPLWYRAARREAIAWVMRLPDAIRLHPTFRIGKQNVKVTQLAVDAHVVSAGSSVGGGGFPAGSGIIRRPFQRPVVVGSSGVLDLSTTSSTISTAFLSARGQQRIGAKVSHFDAEAGLEGAEGMLMVADGASLKQLIHLMCMNLTNEEDVLRPRPPTSFGGGEGGGGGRGGGGRIGGTAVPAERRTVIPPTFDPAVASTNTETVTSCGLQWTVSSTAYQGMHAVTFAANGPASRSTATHLLPNHHASYFPDMDTFGKRERILVNWGCNLPPDVIPSMASADVIARAEQKRRQREHAEAARVLSAAAALQREEAERKHGGDGLSTLSSPLPAEPVRMSVPPPNVEWVSRWVSSTNSAAEETMRMFGVGYALDRHLLELAEGGSPKKDAEGAEVFSHFVVCFGVGGMSVDPSLSTAKGVCSAAVFEAVPKGWGGPRTNDVKGMYWHVDIASSEASLQMLLPAHIDNGREAVLSSHPRVLPHLRTLERPYCSPVPMGLAKPVDIGLDVSYQRFKDLIAFGCGGLVDPHSPAAARKNSATLSHTMDFIHHEQHLTPGSASASLPLPAKRGGGGGGGKASTRTNTNVTATSSSATSSILSGPAVLALRRQKDANQKYKEAEEKKRRAAEEAERTATEDSRGNSTTSMPYIPTITVKGDGQFEVSRSPFGYTHGNNATTQRVRHHSAADGGNAEEDALSSIDQASNTSDDELESSAVGSALVSAVTPRKKNGRNAYNGVGGGGSGGGGGKYSARCHDEEEGLYASEEEEDDDDDDESEGDLDLDLYGAAAGDEEEGVAPIPTEVAELFLQHFLDPISEAVQSLEEKNKKAAANSRAAVGGASANQTGGGAVNRLRNRLRGGGANTAESTPTLLADEDDGSNASPLAGGLEAPEVFSDELDVDMRAPIVASLSPLSSSCAVVGGGRSPVVGGCGGPLDHSPVTVTARHQQLSHHDATASGAAWPLSAVGHGNSGGAPPPPSCGMDVVTLSEIIIDLTTPKGIWKCSKGIGTVSVVPNVQQAWSKRKEQLQIWGRRYLEHVLRFLVTVGGFPSNLLLNPPVQVEYRY